MEISAGRQVHELQMPVWDSLYQVRDFSQYINWIRAEDHAGHPLPLQALNPSRWRLEQAAKGALVTYQMFRDDSDPFGAQLNTRHAFFNPAQLLIYADDLRGSKTSVVIRHIPSGWKVATPLSSAGDVYNSDNYDQMADSPIEISNFEERDFSAPCGRYRVIMDAQDAATLLPKIMSPIEQIVTSASKWMNDCPFQQYMFIYHLSSSPGSGGMEHAFATAITLPAQDTTNDLATITGVTAHEFFHLWNVKRIRPKSLHPIDYTREMDTTVLWFSEGCDSTVADYILLRAGLLDEARYLDHLGQAITELENRTAHSTESAEESSLDAWLEKYPYYGSPERSVSYYNKGNLLGVLLDLRMRDATQDRVSLQTLFRWMNENYAKRNKSFADSDAVRQAAENLTSADFHSFFSDYVSGVREIPWNAFFASVGLRVTSVEAAFPDWGFSAAQNLDQPPTVASVIPGSAAEQVGLTPGDTIEQVNGAPVGRDYQKAIDSVGVGGMLRLRIRRDDQEQELQWSLGVRRETVYHLEDVPEITSQQKARRRNWLFDKAENAAQ
jgi:predicted metalloprotease with PDZ domain